MFGLPYLTNESKRGRRINSIGILADIDGLLKHEDELRNEIGGERRCALPDISTSRQSSSGTDVV